MFPKRIVCFFAATPALLLVVAFGADQTVRTMSYHGWEQALVLSNGKVEAVIVPQIGRVMQFRFAGEEDGPFWENRALDGKKPDSQSSEWGNFGGDKSWPAPQSEWEKITGRGWPPPVAFDSIAVQPQIEGDQVLLTSTVDPHFGIQTLRRIRLATATAEMFIETTYRKMEGEPVRVGIWIITQLKDPELLLMPLPGKSIFPTGYNKQSGVLPLDLVVGDGAVLCRRSPKDSTKVGSDANGIFWGDKTHVVEVRAERESKGIFPDNGSSAEIYTSPDPNAYVELELLGPLHNLKKGDAISRREVYRLHHRTTEPIEKQLRRLAQDARAGYN